MSTPELAMQVADAVHRYGRYRNVTVLPIYGEGTAITLVPPRSIGCSR